MHNSLVSEESQPNAIKVAKSIRLSLTGVATVFEEDSLVRFLTDLSKLIEKPIMISL
jgi:hypothetical protein